MFFKRSSDSGAKSTAAAAPAPDVTTPAAVPPSALSQMATINSAPAAAQPAPTAPQPPQTARGASGGADAARSARQASEAFGQIMTLMMLSPSHQALTLAHVKSGVAPLIKAGQFALLGRKAEATGFSRPMSAILWAEVSEAIDQRLTMKTGGPLSLGRDEISSGPIVWIVDALGDAKGVERLIAQVGQKRWSGRPVKVRISAANGESEVRTIGPF